MSLSNKIFRRAVLKSMGISLALPWLETPNVFAEDKNENNTVDKPKRFACIYFGDGISPDEWTFTQNENNIDLGIALKSLAHIKNKVNFINGLSFHPVSAKSHAKGTAAMLTGIQPLKGNKIQAGVSVDQYIAAVIGSKSHLPSMVLSCERPVSGFHESGHSMTYASHLSWSSSNVPIPPEIYPSYVFDSLFGSSKGASHISILDHVSRQLNDLKNSISNYDRRKLDEYLTSVREIEHRIQQLNASTVNDKSTVKMLRPADKIPKDINEHATLMCDLLSLAFQVNRTQVATLVFANDLSGQLYPFLNVKDNHHSYSHKCNGEEYRKIVRFWVSKYAYLLDHLNSMQEGESTVLDNSCIMLCNEHWDTHSDKKVPLLIAGGLAGSYKTGRIHDFENSNNRSISSFLLGIAHSMGVPLENLGETKNLISLT